MKGAWPTYGSKLPSAVRISELYQFKTIVLLTQILLNLSEETQEMVVNNYLLKSVL